LISRKSLFPKHPQHMNIQQRNNLISIVLILIILVLSYVLVDSIVTPWKEEQARRQLTQDIRTRMTLVRDALIQYQVRSENNSLPATLDSLVLFLKTDSLMVARGSDMFSSPRFTYSADSLILSPRPPHERFIYTVNDTIR